MPGTRLDAFVLAIAIIGLLLCWIIFAWASGRGFDITDDAYYLIWISNPFLYDWSFTEFAFLAHPIYKLIGGNIALLRIVGAALLNACSLVFALATWRLLAPLLPPSARAPYVLAILTASMWAFIWWIPSPGYNPMNLCGVLLFFAALAAVTPVPPAQIGTAYIVAAAVLGALGCVICVLSRATTAVAIVILAALWAIVLRPPRLRIFILSGVVSGIVLLLAASYLIDGGVQAFVQRKIAGYELLALYGPAHSLGIIWPLIVEAFTVSFHPVDSSVLVVTFAFLVLLRLRRQSDGWFDVLIVAVFAFALSALVAILRIGPSDFVSSSYPTVMRIPLMLTIAFAVAFICLSGAEHWRHIVLATVIALAAFASAIGSGNRLTNQATLGGIFFFAACFLLAARFPATVRTRAFALAVAFSSLLPPAVLVGAMANPYRLAAPMWQQTERVTVGPHGAMLSVDASTAAYIRDLQEIAQSNGFEIGTPIIDLSGRSPGAVFALGAEAPGESWLNSNSTGSVPYVKEILSRVPREKLRCAWVLTNPDGRLALPQTVLTSLGLDFPRSYKQVGTSFLALRGETHVLWKPCG
jgi:hypothetical protein